MSPRVRSAPDPRAAQRRAADPAASVWVAASAGTGKTTVLTDRVLSLLLSGTLPTRILCLTFTKAAAAEMANRIALRLGEWATVADEELAGQLVDLTGRTPDGDALERARRLFARVIDAPGGLKIATIHAFCQSVLRRFPLEAGIVPHFEVLDERTAAELMEMARDEVLLRARPDLDPALADALAVVTGYLHEDSFQALMAALAAERGRLARAIDAAGGLDRAIANTWRQFGVEPDTTPAQVVAEASAAGFDRAALAAAAKALATGSEADRARGRCLAEWLAAPKARAARFESYAAAFLTNDGEIRKRLVTKPVETASPGTEAALRGEADRLVAVQERMRAVATAAASAALMRLGGALLDAYQRHKAAGALLDYDDLIHETRRLLEQRGAEWVLYKLDLGLDHILIDEAQDTNPDQWQVVARLADEFFAGAGARDTDRTVFAVGDIKQSIFSFQRADPAAFEAMRRRFAAAAKGAKKGWRDVALDVSFRSTPAVLDAVDAVFKRPAARDGLAAAGEVVQHIPMRAGQAGLVELWPPATPRPRTDAPLWAPPLRREAADSPSARLAALIARRIRVWIESGKRLRSRSRPIHPGDIMVLVRRRTVFVDELIRALKAERVPVAGIDRMVLTDQLAVMDVIALARFLLLPDDDLTLATVLKSPLIGLDEDDLFELCRNRAPRSLWQELGRQAAAIPRYAAAHAYLADLLARADFTPPFELFAEILGAPGRPDGGSGRRHILGRLGLEAEEPLDELLQLALAYERGHVASLEGFLHWFESGQAEIKRDPEHSARDEVRIMTVHGAKGLQAPIVILPDTTQVPNQSPLLLWTDGEAGSVVWSPRRALEDATARRLRAQAEIKRDQEYRRLLYVAMTRAEDRLYVCGWEGHKGRAADCWYDLIQDGLEAVAQPFKFDCRAEVSDGWVGSGLRLVSAQTAKPKAASPAAIAPAAPGALPGWIRRLPPPEPVPARPLAPSRPATDEPAVRSPLGPDAGARFQRGLIIHRLLEALPELPPESRPAACRRFLARPAHGLDAAAQAALAEETLAVLAAPAFAPLFAPGSRAEVPIAGRIGEVVVSGQIDRLAVTADAVLIVDYKTNRPPPETVETVPPLYLGQMAAYRALVRRIYPERAVRCLLLWTDGPLLMPLPDRLLDSHAPGGN